MLRATSLEESYELARSGKADVVAGGRVTLVTHAASFPGARVLDESFFSTGIAVGVPKNRPIALDYVGDFIEHAKASGRVQRALDAADIKGVTVAPPASQR